jgi:hypothetical protein
MLSVGVTAAKPAAAAIKPEDAAHPYKTCCDTLDSKEDANTELEHMSTSAELVHLYQYSPSFMLADAQYYLN